MTHKTLLVNDIEWVYYDGDDYDPMKEGSIRPECPHGRSMVVEIEVEDNADKDTISEAIFNAILENGEGWWPDHGNYVWEDYVEE